MKIITAAMILLLAVCSGSAISADGSALTGADAKVWNGLSRTNWIAQGDGARIVYAIVDPNCPYSRDLFKEVQDLVNPAVVQVRWIPVGVLLKVTEDSRYKAAAAMKGEWKTLSAVMRGRAPEVRPSQSEFAQVDGNADYLDEIAKYAPRGVPKFIYVKEAGNEVRLVTGVPFQAELKKVLR